MGRALVCGSGSTFLPPRVGFSKATLALQPALAAATSAADLDLCFAYLDDVVLAGRPAEVSKALQALCAVAAPAGLVLEPTKSEVVLPNAASSAFCNQHCMTHRVDRAQACLDALAEMPDTQTALLLLRHCASYTKLAYSMRVTPPAAHVAALQQFDSRVRSTLEQLGGLQLTDRAWRQASLRVAAA